MSAKIRVAFCLDSFEIGGTELNAARTAEHLDRSRFQLSVLCLRDAGPLRQRFIDAGATVERFPIRNLYGPSTAREGLRLRRYVRHSVDVLHAHDVYSNIFAGFWGRSAMCPGVLLSKRWWLEQPGWAIRWANRLAYRVADLVLANSPAVARRLERVDHVPAQRIRVIPNFLEDEAFAATPGAAAELRRTLGIAEDAIVVGSVANLHVLKDHVSLLRAVARLAPRWPRLHVVIVGDGPQRAALESLGKELRLDTRLHLTGRLPHAPGLHRAFDISTLTSLHEGFPNTILEAMAAERPVVATAVGGVVDAVRDDLTGLLVPPGDPGALAMALERLVADRELRERMGRAGGCRAREEYAVGRVMPRLESTYEELAALARTRR